MLLTDLVDTSAAVAATRSRKEKVAALAACLGRAQPEEIATVVSYLGGALRQRRTGVGWRGASVTVPPAASPSLIVADVDEAFEQMASLSGPGSQTERSEALRSLLGAATSAEQQWLRGLITGELRQGALDTLVRDALAAATGIPLATVRRAAMLAGGTVEIAEAAVTGGAAALEDIGLEVGRPVLPMLASSAPDVAAAVAKVAGDSGEVSVDVKLDGIRIQVHRDADEVVIATRSLDDITDRLPEVVALVRSFPADRLVLDGEALSLADDGRPRPFQETASRTAQGTADASAGGVTPYFFDLLHVDGQDLLDRPAAERVAALADAVPAAHRVPRLVTADVTEAEAFADAALADGHEGVVVKSLHAAYDAGRRGAGWVKVKPVHTFDFVVLAVEWGSGRRRGLLSNIHLGARDAITGELVMVGKTFKGMTDAMLAWQTERFTALATAQVVAPEDGGSYVVDVRPEQVVEIALDGIQSSTRYPGGVALRFARVVRYRDDKTTAEADTLQALRERFTR